MLKARNLVEFFRSATATKLLCVTQNSQNFIRFNDMMSFTAQNGLKEANGIVFEVTGVKLIIKTKLIQPWKKKVQFRYIPKTFFR